MMPAGKEARSECIFSIMCDIGEWQSFGYEWQCFVWSGNVCGMVWLSDNILLGVVMFVARFG